MATPSNQSIKVSVNTQGVADLDKAINKLNQTLINAKLNSQNNADVLQRYIDNMSKATGVSKTFISTGLNRMIAATGNVNLSMQSLSASIANAQKNGLNLNRVFNQTFNQFKNGQHTLQSFNTTLNNVSNKMINPNALKVSIGQKLVNSIKDIFLGNVLADIFTKGLTFALKSVKEIIGSIIKESIKQSEIIALGTQQFTVLLHNNANAAKSTIKDLIDYAKNSTFDIPGVLDAGKKLLAYGVDASNLKTVMSQLGDISMGNKDVFDGLSLAYGQVAAKGHLMAQESNQFAERGVNLTELLAKSLGKTSKEILKLREAGKISYGDVANAIKKATEEGGQYYKMQEKMQDTLTAKWNKFKQTLQASLGEDGGNLNKSLKDFVDKLQQLVPTLLMLLNGIVDATAALTTQLSKALDQLGLTGTGKIEKFAPHIVSKSNLSNVNKYDLQNQLDLIKSENLSTKDYAKRIIGTLNENGINKNTLSGLALKEYNYIQSIVDGEIETQKHKVLSKTDVDKRSTDNNTANKKIEDLKYGVESDYSNINDFEMLKKYHDLFQEYNSKAFLESKLKLSEYQKLLTDNNTKYYQTFKELDDKINEEEINKRDQELEDLKNHNEKLDELRQKELKNEVDRQNDLIDIQNEGIKAFNEQLEKQRQQYNELTDPLKNNLQQSILHGKNITEGLFDTYSNMFVGKGLNKLQDSIFSNIFGNVKKEIPHVTIDDVVKVKVVDEVNTNLTHWDGGNVRDGVNKDVAQPIISNVDINTSKQINDLNNNIQSSVKKQIDEAKLDNNTPVNLNKYIKLSELSQYAKLSDLNKYLKDNSNIINDNNKKIDEKFKKLFDNWTAQDKFNGLIVKNLNSSGVIDLKKIYQNKLGTQIINTSSIFTPAKKSELEDVIVDGASRTLGWVTGYNIPV